MFFDRGNLRTSRHLNALMTGTGVSGRAPKCTVEFSSIICLYCGKKDVPTHFLLKCECIKNRIKSIPVNKDFMGSGEGKGRGVEGWRGRWELS